ncbi:MAG TPA: LysM peptidoglycan-binding domain-containing protein [Caldilineae bacterium]|nr:LysM peptidoglycan-binding domain-containing protein [Caldilineae bacterium]
MLRSIWFWVTAIGVGLLLVLGRDQIASYVQKIPLQTTPRQTDTQALASASPAIARTVVKTPSPPPTGVAPGATASPSRTIAPSAQSTAKPPVVTQAYTIYVVKKGDTLYRIAKRYHTTAAELQRINGISDPTKLAVGQELKVPKPASANPPAPTPGPGTKVYVVKKGDTLSSIARKFNTSVGTLQKLNNFTNPNQLRVGLKILAPAGSASQTSPTATRPSSATTPPSTKEGADQNVQIMPVLSPSAPATNSGRTTPLTPTAAPTPLPTLPSICEGNQEAAFIWGVSFCIPPGWTLQEYARPYRTALLTKEEATGDLSIYAISRLEGSSNAPLSWTMRQAKSALPTEIAALIPGGLAPPQTWTSATEFEIAAHRGQMSEALTTYGRTGRLAHVRIVVFHAADKRWRIVMIAPEDLWQGYDMTLFPYIARTIEVY